LSGPGYGIRPTSFLRKRIHNSRRPLRLQGIPILFCRHPHPARAFAGRLYPYSSAGTPTPPAPAAGDALTLLLAPPPHPRLCRQATQTLLRPPPPRPRLRQGEIPIRFCWHPHPTRAFMRDTRIPRRHPPPRPRLRRSSPAPSWGRGPCVAISGEQPCPGWSRWATVPGSSPGSPHVLDRGDIATGGGADGEGERVPPPLSPTLQPSYFSPASPAPPAPPAG